MRATRCDNGSRGPHRSWLAGMAGSFVVLDQSGAAFATLGAAFAASRSAVLIPPPMSLLLALFLLVTAAAAAEPETLTGPARVIDGDNVRDRRHCGEARRRRRALDGPEMRGRPVGGAALRCVRGRCP
jgi:hypothetical protein